MKKLVVGLSLAFALLALLLPPAVAETVQPQARTLSVADRAFLSSLTKMPIAATAAAKTPDEPPIGEMALCSASAQCGDGTSVSCQGNNSTTSCSASDFNCPEWGHVTCDGVTIWCPDLCSGPCGPDWCSYEAEYNCAMSCNPCPYTLICREAYCTERCKCDFSVCAP